MKQKSYGAKKGFHVPTSRVGQILLNLLVTGAVGLIVFYVTLPALNLHSGDFYSFVITLCVVYLLCALVTSGFRSGHGAQAPADQLKEYLGFIKKQCMPVAALLVLLALVAALWLLRKVCIAGRLRREETWGCGYQYGTPRVQYTDASFSEPLGRIFGGAMGLKVHQELDAHYFPGKASVAISAPDRLRTGLFTPLFEGVEKLCNMCKILQHGKIHLYILYILATLVALLAWGLHA